MHSTLFFVASLALLAACASAPAEDVIEHIPPKQEPTPSATSKDGSSSGAVVEGAAEVKVPSRTRRNVGQESDLLPSGHDVDASPFGEVSQVLGRNRIRVLPAYLG